jgi:hypothetical protein
MTTSSRGPSSGLANEPGHCAVHIRSLMKSSGNQRKIPVDADVAGGVDRLIEAIIIGFLIATAIPAILIVGVLLYQWWILRHPIEPDVIAAFEPTIGQVARCAGVKYGNEVSEQNPGGRAPNA